MRGARMNVAVSVNAAFIMPLKVMLYSLACNTDKELHVYLLYSSLKASERKSIRDFVEEKCCGTLYEIAIDDSIFAEYLDTTTVCSVETFYRLLLPYILDPAIERILWLDADMVICGNIDSFYDADMGSHYLCVARDIKRGAPWLELGQEQVYFNAGLLTINLAAIRKDIPKKRIFDFFIQHHQTIRYGDQDVLNCLMGHNTLMFDEKIYNCQKHLSGEITDDVRVIHYLSNVKPWMLYYCGSKRAADSFWAYACQCGFKRNMLFRMGNSIARFLYPFFLKMRPGRLYGVYHRLKYGYPYCPEE